MKAVVLFASPRKVNTYAVCELIRSELPAGTEFEYINIAACNISDCKGCCACFNKSEKCCPCRGDELASVLERLKAADGIIFASPVYACQINAYMKRVIDRFSYLFHRPELVGKPALTVVTSDGGGIPATRKYLKMTACGWGCSLCGEITVSALRCKPSASPAFAKYYDPRYEQKTREDVKKASQRFLAQMRATTPRQPTFYDIYMFEGLRSKTYFSEADKRFWTEKGWLDSNYYYPVKLSPAKRLFGVIMRKAVELTVASAVKTPAKQPGLQSN